MGENPDRRGWNEVEAVIARAVLQYGGSSDLLDGLEPGAARALRPRVDELAEASEERRSEVVEAWAEREGRRDDDLEMRAEGPWARAVRSYREDEEPFDWIESERMRRALAGLICGSNEEGRPVREERLSKDPEHFDVVVRMEPEAFRVFAVEFGIFQIAQLVRDRNRRRIARVARQLSGRRRELFVEALQSEREPERRERSRLREVFVTLSQHYEELQERAEQLGLYSIARAGSRRFRGRIVRLCEKLPDRLGERLARYYRMSYESTRKGVGWHVRESLEEFLRLRRELADEDEDDGSDE